MSSKYYLTIKDFPEKGRNFKTDVEFYNFGHPHQDFSWSAQTLNQTSKPLFITRKKDKQSSLFMGMAFKSKLEINGVKNIEKYPEATLTLDQYDKKRGLQSRTIYGFSDFEVIGYSDYGKTEEIKFNFAKASSFVSSVETITSP